MEERDTHLDDREGHYTLEEAIREKYDNFKKLQTANNESLEGIATLQEELRFINPSRRSLGDLLDSMFESTEKVVEALDYLADYQYHKLHKRLARQKRIIEKYLDEVDEADDSPLWTHLHALSLDSLEETGGKAAYLGEVANIIGLPVPEGFVLTTSAYSLFCGNPMWREMKDRLAGLDVDDSELIDRCSAELVSLVEELKIPPELRLVIQKGLWSLSNRSDRWAVRSSAVGEGGEFSFAGQFESLLNVPSKDLIDAYKKVIASRFSPRAIKYRLMMGIPEIENRMAVLFLPILNAASSGMMYTRDPENPSGENIIISSRFGLGEDLASGGASGDMYEVSRSKGHEIIKRKLVDKESAVLLNERGGTVRIPLTSERHKASLNDKQCATLAEWGMTIEKHFDNPQDVEWVLDRRGKLWIVQTRPLVTSISGKSYSRKEVKIPPIISGGTPIFPGRTSGPPHFAENYSNGHDIPPGSILVTKRPSPEIVRVLPRLSGLIAEQGAVTGHGAALLRDFKLPSVFHLEGAFTKLALEETISLDAARGAIYSGKLWSPKTFCEDEQARRRRKGRKNLLRKRIIRLHLTDPHGFNFKPWGCKSLHDVLRFSHEKAVEEMFDLNDRHMGKSTRRFRRLVTSTPMDLYVLDLGGGISSSADPARPLVPEDLDSKPFRALWKGIQHEGVSWSRKAPPSVGGFASVLARSIADQNTSKRALGDVSYLLVSAEHMNLNARLAYHFTMVDASVSPNPNNNHITFRFAGGGAGAGQRALRVSFIRDVLNHYGFKTEVRGDLLNAWFKRGSEDETISNLDILGRMLVSSSQLDMYMTSREASAWCFECFLAGNYTFEKSENGESILVPENSGEEE